MSRTSWLVRFCESEKDRTIKAPRPAVVVSPKKSQRRILQEGELGSHPSFFGHCLGFGAVRPFLTLVQTVVWPPSESLNESCDPNSISNQSLCDMQ